MTRFLLFSMCYLTAFARLSAQSVLHEPYYPHDFDTYFAEAYATYPTLPHGVLEAIAYTNTRIHHLTPTDDTTRQSCIGLPFYYGVMGLVADGKGWFRENLRHVATLSGHTVAQLQQSPHDNIMGFAAAFAAVQQSLQVPSNNPTENISVLRQLSELPYLAQAVVNDFAMNSHLYSVLYHLNLPVFQQQYGLPAYHLDLKAVFGSENYALVSASQLDLSHEYERQQSLSDDLTQSLQAVCAMPSGPAEYAPAVAFDEPADNYSGTIAPYLIAIHDIEGTYAGAISWFNNPSSDVSAHYCMRGFDGQVTQMVCHRRKAWHVSAENAYAVGIEHEGYAAQGEAWYTNTMYQSSAALTRFIADDLGTNKLQTYDGPPISDVQVFSHTCYKIKGHQMFINNNHSDPGPAWDWPYYYTLINDLPAPTTIFTAASATVYDSGGSAGNYADEERRTWLIQPNGTTPTAITLTFTTYSVENNYDYLWIYDGTDNTGALIGKYSGTSPGVVTAYSGAIFLEFRSDCATTQAGWAANYTIVTTPQLCPIPSNFVLTPSALYCGATWDSVSSATGYELSWKRSLDATWTTQTVSTTAYIITGLTAGAVYESRVRAVCSSGVYSGYLGEIFVSNDPATTTTAAGVYIVNQCEGTFKDSGGSSWHYANAESWTYTIAPAGASSVTLIFSSFETENNYDFLYVYNGNSIASPLIGIYSGTTSPGTVVSSSGALTLQFVSDNSTTKPGWSAIWSCTQAVMCAPLTAIGALPAWQSDDFPVSFTDTDACSSGGLTRFWLVREYAAGAWTANNSIGFFDEEADAATLHAQWTSSSGTWAQSGGNIAQSNQTNTNTNLYAPLTTDNTATYLFHWRMRMGGTGSNRRAGLHFFCSDATQTQRGNSYMVYFRVDNDKTQIYETVNNSIGSPKTDDPTTLDPNVWYDYKVTYNPQNGQIKAYVDNVLQSQWTSVAPHQSGIAVSLRSGECTADYDFLRVYRSRLAATPQTVTVGTNSNDMVRSQNAAPTEEHCQIQSIVVDNNNKWSGQAMQITGIDWTAPATVSVNDGSGADIDLSAVSNQLTANWTSATDVHSGIAAYWYAVGTTAGGTDIVDWTNNGTNTAVVIQPLNLLAGITYFVSVRVVNAAGLYSVAGVSDGITVCVPATTVNAISNWQTDDFTAIFADTDCGVGIKARYYCVTDFNGSEWRGNGLSGYFYDSFGTATIHPDWTTLSGSWAISGNGLVQSDATLNNTNIYATVQQNSSTAYLYEWDAQIGGAGTNRRMGLHIFCDNPSLSNRGNSYFIWYRADNDKLQFYKVTADVFELMTEVNATVNTDIWQHYALSYDPASGQILMFRDGVLLATWTDPAPLLSGTAVSFRTGNSQMWIDNFAVYRSRSGTTGAVTLGNSVADAVRYQSTNPTTDAGKVSSRLLNNSWIFAPENNQAFKVDWTAPTTVSINDGTGADIDQTTDNTQLSANWTSATDAHSGVVGYQYAVGTTAGATDVVAWANNGMATAVTITALTLSNGVTYYVSVRALNAAGLYSIAGVSDGQTVVLCSVPVQPATIAGATTTCTGVQTYSVTNTAGLTYTWSATGGTITSGQGTNAVAVTWSGAGAQTLSCTPANSCGNGTARTQSVTVNTIPAQPSNIVGSTVACTDDVAENYNVTNVSGVTYNWAVSGGGTLNSAGNSASIIWATAGNYILTVIPNNTCGNGTARTFNVLIKQTPNPIVSGNAIVCPAFNETYTVPNVLGNTYLWSVTSNGAIMSGQGTHSVVVQWNNGTAGSVWVTETNP